MPTAHREDIVHALLGLAFPAKKDDIFRNAEYNRAREGTLEELDRLPEAKKFQDSREVMRALDVQ